jgi:hypothetical protein
VSSTHIAFPLLEAFPGAPTAVSRRTGDDAAGSAGGSKAGRASFTPKLARLLGGVPTFAYSAKR